MEKEGWRRMEGEREGGRGGKGWRERKCEVDRKMLHCTTWEKQREGGEGKQ